MRPRELFFSDGSGTLLRKFVYDPGIDEPICLIEVADNNAVYYYHFDGLGSVVALSDVNSVLVERYTYDVFGRPTIRDANGTEITESAFANPYLFTLPHDSLSIHHLGQAHWMEQLVAGYSQRTGPAIVVSEAEHLRIPKLHGTVNLPPRQALANDIRNMRAYTGAPNASLEELIRLNKQMYPGAFAK